MVIPEKQDATHVGDFHHIKVLSLNNENYWKDWLSSMQLSMPQTALN